MADRAIHYFLFFLAASLPFSIAVSHVSLGALFLLAGYKYGIKKDSLISTPLDYAIILYLSIVLISGLVGFSPTRSLLSIAAHWHIAIYLMVANWLPDRKTAIRLIYVIFAVAALNGLYGIIQYYSGGLDLFRTDELILTWGDHVRATGTYRHFMTFAGQMLMMILFGIGLLLFWARGPVFWVLASAVALLFGGLLFSLTRSAWLGLVAGLLAIGWLKGWKALALLTATLVAAILLSFTMYPELRERAASIANLKTDQSNLERIRMWRATLDMIQDHLLLGVGIGNYRMALDQYRDRYGAGSHSDAHNTLLQQTAQNGLIGLAAFVMIWYLFFREGIRNVMDSSDPFIRGVTAGAIGALVGFHVAGLFEHNLGDSEVAMMMWFIVGMAMAARTGNFEVYT